MARGLGHHLRDKFAPAHELADGTAVDGHGQKRARAPADGLVGIARNERARLEGIVRVREMAGTGRRTRTQLRPARTEAGRSGCAISAMRRQSIRKVKASIVLATRRPQQMLKRAVSTVIEVKGSRGLQ